MQKLRKFPFSFQFQNFVKAKVVETYGIQYERMVYSTYVTF